MRWLILAALLAALIVVPFLFFERGMNAWVEQFFRLEHHTAAIGAAVVSLLALDVLLPVPSSIVSTAAGAMLGLVPGVLASTAGMTLGCTLGYACGRKWGSALVRRVVGEREAEQVSAQFRKGAIWALAIMRPVPVLAEASALIAGVSGVPFPMYLAVTTFANAGISIIYCTAGASAFLPAFAASIVLPGLAMAVSRLIYRRR
jgi:uncharacterized membrane protein YdjX (TVP38/TMEM64 family)